MKLFYAVLLSVCFGFGSSGAPVNLLEGDCDAETTPLALTSGDWSFPGNPPRWRHDPGVGYQSKSSLALNDFCGLAVRKIKLPAGTYTFSFYAKSATPDTTAYITVNPIESTWDNVLRNRARGMIKLGTQWKRYSHTFQADGKNFYSPYYGIAKKGLCHFDRFMLNAGDRAAAWEPAAVTEAWIALPKSLRGVFPVGRDIPVAVTFPGAPGEKIPVRVTVSDWRGRVVHDFKAEARMNDRGRYTYKFSLPGSSAQWFAVEAWMRGAFSARHSVAVVRPVEKLMPGMTPFVGLCGTTVHPEAAAMIGVRWAEVGLNWPIVEGRPGVYDFSGTDFAKLRKLGFSTKMLISLAAPSFRQTPELRRMLAAGQAELHRLLPPESELETSWRAMIRELMKQHGKDIDIFELGGELDALIGLSTIYKRQSPDQLVGPFVTGPVLARICRQIDIAIEEILRTKPDALISAVRPSDVDARYGYAYSKAVFAKLKHARKLNRFGIDCYPQPRWIAADQPPTGTEQDLRKRFNDSREAMKPYCGRNRVFISEYGYFLDDADRFNRKYQTEQANRLSRSFLMARHLGFESLFYFYAAFGAGQLEAARFAMSIWEHENPHLAVAALSSVAAAVENVAESCEKRFNDRVVCLLFRKSDGRAFAALWALDKSSKPELRLDGTGLRCLDMLGNEFPARRQGREIQLPLGEEPLFVEFNRTSATAYQALRSRFEKANLREAAPVAVTFRPAERNRLKAYVVNPSATELFAGTIAGSGGRGNFVVPAGATAIVDLPLPRSGREEVYTVTLEGDHAPFECRYTLPELFVVPRIAGLRCDGRLDGAWKNLRPVELTSRDHIMPVDHTTWNGPEDLSGRLYVAHDGKMLYCAMEVRDEAHYNKFTGKDIWRGDALQLAFDPLTNHISGRREFDGDDVHLTAALTGHGAEHVVHGAPDAELAKRMICRVVRDQQHHTTLYQVALPLELLSPKMRSGRIFGMNAIVFDDDTGSKADYWLFFRPGFGGAREPEKFGQFILE